MSRTPVAVNAPGPTMQSIHVDVTASVSAKARAQPDGGLCDASERTNFQFDGDGCQLLRVEAMSTRGARCVTGGLQATILVALLALIALTVAKHAFPENTRLQHVNNDGFAVAKAASSLVLAAVVVPPLVTLLVRLRASGRLGLTWSRRRSRAVTHTLWRAWLLVALLAIMLSVNVAAVAFPALLCRLVPQAIVGAAFNLIWNSLMLLLVLDARSIMLAYPASDSQATVGDLPWRRRLGPVLLLWLPTTGLSVALAAHQLAERDRGLVVHDGVCTFGENHTCDMSRASVVGTTLWLLLTVVYAVVHFVYLWRTRRQLRHRLYQRFRVLHILLQVQLRFSVVFFAFWIASVTALWFFGGACNNWTVASTGVLPCLFVLAGTTAVQLYMVQPILPSDGPPRPLAELQRFTWTERQQRKRQNAREAASEPTVPSFCVETAIKLFFWSTVLYDFSDEAGHKFGGGWVPEDVRSLVPEVQGAMQLYGLQARRVFYERAYGTKVVVAWGGDTILVAARGSREPINFLHDCDLSQTQHPASAVPSHRGSRVHRGFLASWQANGLSDRVSEHVGELLDTAGDRRHVRVLTCGHSLGGAIASLAALELAQRCDIEPAQLSCYTFGCPRTGNHAFAALHAKWVPDTWHVINDQDIVTRQLKLLRYYKRHGNRVIINASGDLVVRPSFLEFSLLQGMACLLQNPFRGSVEQHMNQSYHEALCAVASAQLEARQRHADGPHGLMCLLQDLPMMREAIAKHAHARGIPFGHRMSQLGAAARRGSLPRAGSSLTPRWPSLGNEASAKSHGTDRSAQPLTPESADPAGGGTCGAGASEEFVLNVRPESSQLQHERSSARKEEHSAGALTRCGSSGVSEGGLTAELRMHMQASLHVLARLQSEIPDGPSSRDGEMPCSPSPGPE